MGKLLFCLPTFFIPSDKRSTGGTISNYLLISELSHYHEVEVISPIISSEILKKENKNISIITTEGLDGDSYFIKAKKKLWLNEAIKRRAAKGNIELFIGTNGTASFIHNLHPQKSIIITRAYEDFLDYVVNGESRKEVFRKKILKFLINRKVKSTYNDAKMIITNSEFMKNEIKKYFNLDPKKIHVLYPPINIEGEKFRSLPGNEKIIIGMINPKKIKGEDIFLSLADQFPDICFVYFSREDKLFSKKNIKYLGWGTNLQKMYKSFDVLIVPSFWNEPFGRVAVEGIRSGLPVLVSNRGGIPETVDKSFVVENDDIDTWEKKLNWLLDNPNEVESAWLRSEAHSQIFLTSSHNAKVKEFFSVFFNSMPS